MFQRAGIRTEQQVLILQSQTLLALTAMIDKENFKGNARYIMLLEFHLGILYHSVKVTLQLFHFKVVIESSSIGIRRRKTASSVSLLSYFYCLFILILE